MTSPVSQSGVVEAVVDGLSTDGRGIAHLGGRAVFLPRTFPGDRVRLELIARTYPPAARVIELCELSPSRTPHPCPHAASCAGSVWGALNYAAQLAAKSDLVERTLRKMLGPVAVKPVVASPQTWRYRNRITLNVWVESRTLRLGFQTEARQVHGVEIAECHLCSETLSACLTSLAARWKETAILMSASVPRRLQIHETAAGPGALLVFAGVVSRAEAKRWAKSLPREILPGGVWFASGTRGGIVSPVGSVLHGDNARAMTTKWLDETIEVHPASFCQANVLAANLVLRAMRNVAAVGESARVWDLYGGYGSLGLAAAEDDQLVLVFEQSAYSRETLEDLAVRRRRKIEFVQGDLRRTFPPQARKVGIDDTIILDPPRSGVHPDVLRALGKSKARRVIYLSCNPARLARDIVLLRLSGFEITDLQPFDFFPQTPNVEVLAILRRL